MSIPYKDILAAARRNEPKVAQFLRGAAQLADAVRVTLGPRSKSVLIQRKWGAQIVCNDGVTLAKEFELKDPEENLGARMIRDAAVRTGEAVGDGTTTATVLARAIFTESPSAVTHSTRPPAVMTSLPFSVVPA